VPTISEAVEIGAKSQAVGWGLIVSGMAGTTLSALPALPVVTSACILYIHGLIVLLIVSVMQVKLPTHSWQSWQ
jgi:hypothetical protein